MTPQEQYWKQRCEAAEKFISSNKSEDYKKWTQIRHSPNPDDEIVEPPKTIADVRDMHKKMYGEDGTLDLSDISEDYKREFIDGLVTLTCGHLMTAFLSLGLKTHITATVEDPETKELYDFSFTKKVDGNTQPPTPAQGVEEEEYPITPVIFFELKNGKYLASNGKEVETAFLIKNEHFIHHNGGYVIPSGSRWQQGQDNHRGFTVTRGDGNKYQLCPKCNGQGRVSKPPHIPEGVDSWSSCELDYECNVCNGQKIILSPQPPAPTIGARWVRASERMPDDPKSVTWRETESKLGIRFGTALSTIHDYDPATVEWSDESPCIFPTREEAETFANQFPNTMEGNRQMHGALAMYDWIFNPQKDK